MKELTSAKRIEVATHYLLGDTYSEIEDKTGVSHGSIANIVGELEAGKLDIGGTPADQLDDLRNLVIDLKGKHLTATEARLGAIFFKRLEIMGITPESLELWGKLVKELSPAGYPVREFFDAAARLHTLEAKTGKTFEAMTAEYASCDQEVTKLKEELNLLAKQKQTVRGEIKSASATLEALEKKTDILKRTVTTHEGKLQELNSEINRTSDLKSTLDREINELERRKASLASQIGASEKVLEKLERLGLVEEDLLRVKTFVLRLAKDSNADPHQVKEELFAALALYRDAAGLERRADALANNLRELDKKKAILTGEVAELERLRDISQGELDASISATTQRLKALGEEAISQVQQYVGEIKGKLDEVVGIAVAAGKSVTAMNEAVATGQRSAREFQAFVADAEANIKGGTG